MSLLYPEAIVLLIPAISAWWWIFGRDAEGSFGAQLKARLRRRGAVLLLLLLTLFVLLASAPSWVLAARGSDLVVLVDRSRSMPRGSLDSAREIIALAEKQRGSDDRIAVMGFGARPAVESAPSQDTHFGSFIKDVGDDASDLASAVDMAAGIIPDDRSGRVLILSDGESTGFGETLAASKAGARGTIIDFRHQGRETTHDVAVASLDLPSVLQPGEAFQFSGWITATADAKVNYALERRGEVIVSDTLELTPGRHRLFFRDRLWRKGLTEYVLRIDGAADAVPENDRGRGVVRVEGEGQILLLTGDGTPGNLGRALLASGRTVRVAKPSDVPFTLDFLDAYRLIILENVPSTALDEAALQTIARYVKSTGGGLLMTGGKRSFGIGGYYKSALAPVLPVTMELREEHRKLRMALVVVLDRSGSMTMTVASGVTKMDLANAGTAEAIRLLAESDEIAVIPVDTSPDIVQPLSVAKDRGKILARVLDIKTGGGGIYTYTGLKAAGDVLVNSDASTRHIILFADAADADEPGEYQKLLADYRVLGITVSVVALGTEKDKDSAFLKDVAERGGGQFYVTEDATALPRLFTMDTIAASRSAWVEADTPLALLPDVVQVGDLTQITPTRVGGYNLTYLRPEATAGFTTVDEFNAPAFAFWQHGLGRVATFAGEVDGEFSGDLAPWKDFDRFFTTVADWLIDDGSGGIFAADLKRDGHTVTVRLELDPEDRSAWPKEVPRLIATPDHPALPVIDVPLIYENETTLSARYEIGTGNTYHHRVVVGKTTLRLPAVTLPYSPEFEPRSGRRPGHELLSDLARITGGKERLHLEGLFEHESPSARSVPLTPYLALVILLLTLYEIAQRRLQLGLDRGVASSTRRKAPPVEMPVQEATIPAPSPLETPESSKPKEDPLEAFRRAKDRVDRRFH